MDTKKFFMHSLEHPLHISGVVSVFYSDVMPNFNSRGEQHDFWEMVYVDRGQIHVETNSKDFYLKQGQIVFHPPMEYHKHSSGPNQYASLCVSAFSSESSVLSPLVHGPFYLNEEQQKVLSHVMKHGTEIFSSLVDEKDSLYLVKKSDRNPLSEQIFTNYLEVFLLFCLAECITVKHGQQQNEGIRNSDVISRNHIEHIGKRAVDYLKAHVEETVTIAELCSELGCSKTTLSTSFKAYTGTSIIPFFNRLKIETAKMLMRTEDMSLTEISTRLNFCNLNYFSTAFKNYAGMYPREYAKSLKIYNGVYLVNAEHDAIRSNDSTDSVTQQT